MARATQVTEQYTYDANGARVKRIAGVETRLYAGGGLWEESLGTTLSGYAWETRAVYLLQGRPVAQQDKTPNPTTLSYLHGDQLGSVSVVTSASGAVVSRQEYTPWGEVRAGGTGQQTALDFTGQRKDASGLLYYHARYYDPALARFLSADTAPPGKENPQSRNRYAYVSNNPPTLSSSGNGGPSPHGNAPRPTWMRPVPVAPASPTLAPRPTAHTPRPPRWHNPTPLTGPIR